MTPISSSSPVTLLPLSTADAQNASHGCPLTISNLTLALPLPRKRKKIEDIELAQHITNVILDNISLHVPSNHMCAIIGASGSGKTTLLNVIAQRTKANKMKQTGDIYYGDEKDITKVNTAYVVQQDILTTTLTVRETLRYAAELRLRLPRHDREQIVEQIILQLGLKECANTRIGSTWNRGCSGGEKRRVSVAIQLLKRPSLMFLVRYA